ncbi:MULTISPECIES: hypothetical protein [Okeania]|uniref:hypothetical protein n=1 Tax=Okeania TaxID=1458928 RepID=UPI0013750F89|nr:MULTISPECIES: hypothetical protein [Okeania]NEP40570.1 hypothetical protein [Okeania sp. SIO2H7]NET12943.1 hypothetical protein [Okeania sp. SIO1H6]NEP72219.1 hypothetical protein [Okeania sp. SIO2G5]NEP85583.1 hypothetical protein [Okeania sp. SIO2C2]NEP92263.1 hypothetical protein [Okeania sp. SIO2F5]
MAGHIDAKSDRPGPGHKLKGSQELISKLVPEKPDATFRELCSKIQAKTGITFNN